MKKPSRSTMVSWSVFTAVYVAAGVLSGSFVLGTLFVFVFLLAGIIVLLVGAIVVSTFNRAPGCHQRLRHVLKRITRRRDRGAIPLDKSVERYLKSHDEAYQSLEKKAIAKGLPTFDEINVFDSLDEREAVRNFFGKSLEEVEDMFCHDAFSYFEDLMWMGPKAFCFYVQALIRYFRSEHSVGDSETVSGFLGVMYWRLECEQHELSDVLGEIRDVVQYISDNPEKFYKSEEGLDADCEFEQQDKDNCQQLLELLASEEKRSK